MQCELKYGSPSTSRRQTFLRCNFTSESKVRPERGEKVNSTALKFLKNLLVHFKIHYQKQKTKQYKKKKKKPKVRKIQSTVPRVVDSADTPKSLPIP